MSRELTEAELRAEEAEYDRLHGLDGSAVGLLGEPRSNGHGTVSNPLLSGLRNGAWLDAQDFPPLSYAVPGIIPEGSTLLVGAPKIGKSWAMLDVALGLAIGGVAFGHIRTGEPRPVLVCALEDSERRLQDRCRKLLGDAPIPPLFQFLTRVEPDAVFSTLDAWFDSYGPDERPVAWLDTLGRVMPPAHLGESSYQRDYRVGAMLKKLVDDRPGASLITNHHDRKAGSDDFIDSVSGTHGLAGAADTTVVLARNRLETTGLVKVTGRDVIEAEYAMRIVDGIAWQLDGPDLVAASRRATEVRATASLGDRSVEVLAYVNQHAAGVAPKDVQAALNLPDARKYLQRLADADRIRKGGRGLYLPLSQPSQVSQSNGGTGQSGGCDTPLEPLDFTEPNR